MRRMRALAVIGLMVGCMPTRFQVAPYDEDRAAANALGEHAAARCAERRGQDAVPEHPFTSDGCSSWPDSDWAACCVEHDMAYWCGGSAADRRRADDALAACVARRSSRAMAATMRIGVIAGGIPWQPMPWRWGYGFDGVRGYDE